MSVNRIFTMLCLAGLCLGSARIASAASVTGAAQVFAHGVLTLAGTQINGDLTNGGTLNVVSSGTITGTLLNQGTGSIFIGAFTVCGGTAQLTMTSGVTNQGQVSLRTSRVPHAETGFAPTGAVGFALLRFSVGCGDERIRQSFVPSGRRR